jgi:two-component system, NtrC family, response regulator HydG
VTGGSTGSRSTRASLVLPPRMILGPSAAMRRLLEQLEPTVRSGLDVLLLGETGTGKELFARVVHDNGPTAEGPFVAINCAAIPSDMLEAELFGVETRVATGVDPRPGLFQAAAGGSILLDEIAEMPLSLQAKLLRVLQEREVMPIGGRRPVPLHIRVISASNTNVPRLAREGRFRADLYYRLRGLQFHLPPLRDRREDVPVLAADLAARAAARHGKQVGGLSRRALELLAAHDWPGNVRELESEVERAVLLCADGGQLEARHFLPIKWAVESGGISGELGGPIAPTDPVHQAVDPAARPERGPRARPSRSSTGTLLPLAEEVASLERRSILRALEKSRGNKSAAARLLGITRNGLYLKMERLGIAD